MSTQHELKETGGFPYHSLTWPGASEQARVDVKSFYIVCHCARADGSLCMEDAKKVEFFNSLGENPRIVFLTRINNEIVAAALCLRRETTDSVGLILSDVMAKPGATMKGQVYALIWRLLQGIEDEEKSHPRPARYIQIESDPKKETEEVRYLYQRLGFRRCAQGEINIYRKPI